MRRARRAPLSRASAAAVAVAQMSASRRDARLQPRRIRAGPQHPLVVVRLEHEDVDVAAQRSHIARSRGRCRSTSPRAPRSDASSTTNPTGSRRVVRDGAGRDRRMPVDAHRLARAAAVSRATSARLRDCTRPVASRRAPSPSAARRARRRCTWSLCSCVTRHASIDAGSTPIALRRVGQRPRAEAARR